MPTMRIPSRLVEELKKEAVKQRRSAAKQLLVILEERYKDTPGGKDLNEMTLKEQEKWFNEDPPGTSEFP